MAPRGGQLPNGETTPTGDALKVAPIAARHGATVTIRMPDIYPNFPYRWVSMDDWRAKVRRQVGDRLASPPARGRYALTVGYSNGTGATARHHLAVNGRPAGESTVRLSHAAGTADLDFVDLASAR